MRYTGGLAGGSWVTALAGDLGSGKFDGGMLVENFENLNPSNTYWTKSYNLWSKVDTEGRAIIEFEKWWGGHVNLNAEEIQWIVDELFVGNRLATAEIVTATARGIDLRNIRSPIICFCSKGDNITPPQQALGWIVDLYGSDDDIRACGQTDRLLGPRERRPPRHLRLGRRGEEGAPGVRLEHRPDRRAAARPVRGVMTPRGESDVNPEAIGDDWIGRFEPRSLDDSPRDRQARRRERAPLRRGAPRLGDQPRPLPLAGAAVHPRLDQRPERRMVEEAQPRRAAVRGVLRAEPADAAGVAARGDGARAAPARRRRQPAAALAGAALRRNHPGARRLSRPARRQPRAALPRDLRLAGGPVDARRGPERCAAAAAPGLDPERAAAIEARIAELKAGVAEGGAVEAAIRALIFVGLAGPGVDERAFNTLREMRAGNRGLGLENFKRIVRAQYFSLVLDPEAALAAIPKMLPADAAARRRMVEAIRRTIEAAGAATGERAERLARIEALFVAGRPGGAARSRAGKTASAKARAKTPAKTAAKAAAKAAKAPVTRKRRPAAQA
jgi:hypothetical protein